MISTTMVSDLYITFGLIGVFLAGMIAVLDGEHGHARPDHD